MYSHVHISIQTSKTHHLCMFVEVAKTVEACNSCRKKLKNKKAIEKKGEESDLGGIVYPPLHPSYIDHSTTQQCHE